VTLEAGEANWEVDFAFVPLPAQFGDRVWVEDDGDGDAATGAIIPVAGMVITARNGTDVYTTTTNAQGYYSFTVPGTLSEQTYTVSYGDVPAQYGAVEPSATLGGDSESGNAGTYEESGDPDESHRQNTRVTLGAGEANWEVDFAFVPLPAQFGDRVWVEDDGDGDAATGVIIPVAGMVITATNGIDVFTTTTNANGYYSFTVPGTLTEQTYTVSYGDVPAQYGAVEPSNTPGGGSESGNAGIYAESGNPDQSHTNGTTVTLVAGEANWQVDFAFVPQPFFDLALRKILSSSTILPIEPGDDITFTVVISNQGTADAYRIEVTDFLPTGLTLSQHDSNNWQSNGALVSNTVPFLADGDETTLEIVLTINRTFQGTSLTNVAEISAADDDTNPSNSPPTDVDSTPDSDPSNEKNVKDNVTDEDGTVPGEDEDDHDLETVPVQPLASLGDLVWEDWDHDGIQDPNEPGIPGVTVTLLKPTGEILTTTTDGSGNYRFLNLSPNVPYTVTFTSPDGYEPTLLNVGDDAKDSDGHQVVVTLQPGEHNPTIDSGFWRPAGIGDHIWYDDNRNGQQDGNEAGVPDVKVELLNSSGQVISTTTSNANGDYRFMELPTGDYAIRFDTSSLPDGYQVTGQDQGNDAEDSDADRTTGETTLTNLQPGEYDPTWDAGIHLPLISLGDFVWLDGDRDGQQDANEEGVPNVVVQLTLADGTVLTTTTDATGGYRFTDLVPNQQVTVTFNLPDGYTVTTPNSGDDALDSDPNPAGVVVVDLKTTDDYTIDAGLLVDPVRVGDVAFLDLNRNGIQDAADQPLPGVLLHLTNADGSPVNDIFGNPVADQTTASNGTYRFENLPPGEYTVTVVNVPSGYLPTLPNVGAPDLDSSTTSATSNPATGNAAVPGGEDMTLDFGFVPMVGVGNLVWHDANNNGLVDAGEAGIPGVTVQLFREQDDPLTATPLQSMVTDATGAYHFAGLAPGRYFVYIPTAPSLYPVSSTSTESADNGVDNDDNGMQVNREDPVRSPVIELAVGVEPTNDGDDANGDLTIDFGFFEFVSLGDFVWLDLDQDGVQDAGETGVAGVVVTLYDALTNDVVATTTTDANGNYLFDELLPGTYVVEFTLPSGYFVSPQNSGSDDEVDSDGDPTTVQTEAITLESGEHDPSWDLGLVVSALPASIGDTVWYDADADGVQDDDESGVPGVLVTLYQADGTSVATTHTDVDGHYEFTNLSPGDYYLEFTPRPGYISTLPDQGADDTVDSDVEPTTRQTTVTTLQPGENDMSWDYGLFILDNRTGALVAPAGIGNRVWEDVDYNGLQDVGEPDVSGVIVRLYSSDGQLIATDVTDEKGEYLFLNLLPGDYYIEFVVPSGYTVTMVGTDPTSDSDSNADLDSGRTPVTTLESGEVDLTLDLGIYRAPTNLGDDGEPMEKQEHYLYLPLIER